MARSREVMKRRNTRNENFSVRFLTSQPVNKVMAGYSIFKCSGSWYFGFRSCDELKLKAKKPIAKSIKYQLPDTQYNLI